MKYMGIYDLVPAALKDYRFLGTYTKMGFLWPMFLPNIEYKTGNKNYSPNPNTQNNSYNNFGEHLLDNSMQHTHIEVYVYSYTFMGS